MSSLKRVQIGDFIDVLTDYHSNGSYKTLKDNVTLLPVKDYAIMIRTLNFERNDFSDDLIYVDKSAYEHLAKSKVYPNDILTNKIANPGSIYIMPDLHCPVTCGMNLFLIRFSSTVNQRYMYYCMKNAEEYIKSFAHGTTTKTITKDEVRSIDLLIHTDIKEQNTIENLLSSIDRKIEINQKVNDNLQHQLKLMYDYWFTQFDFPDENGKPYRSSGCAMVWNEQLKRKIPLGWKVSTLASLISKSKNGDWGKEFPKSKDDIRVSCFRGADFKSITDDYSITAPIRYISSKHDDRLLADGDLIIEISGGSPTQSTGRIGYINNKILERNGGKMDCSNFCKAFSPKEKIYQYWIYHTWEKLYDAGIMFNFEGKTTGIKNLMFDEFISSILLPIPPDALMKKYQTICALNFDVIQTKLIESARLSELQNWLLPMLMNGQATIAD